MNPIDIVSKLLVKGLADRLKCARCISPLASVVLEQDDHRLFMICLGCQHKAEIEVPLQELSPWEKHVATLMEATRFQPRILLEAESQHDTHNTDEFRKSIRPDDSILDMMRRGIAQLMKALYKPDHFLVSEAHERFIWAQLRNESEFLWGNTNHCQRVGGYTAIFGIKIIFTDALSPWDAFTLYGRRC